MIVERADIGTLFDGKQRDFLRECVDLRIALGGLAPLGPVQATKWKNVMVGGFDTNIERWTTADLDFLELSIRSESGAEQQQLGFEAAVRALGLAIDEQEPKTRRVLTKLARAASKAKETNDG